MTTTNERGYICSQNVAAIAAFGCHVPCGNGPVSEQGNSWEQGNGHNFLEMLFHGHPVGPMPYLFALVVPACTIHRHILNALPLLTGAVR